MEYILQNMECKVGNIEYRVWSMEYILENIEFKIQNRKYKK